MVTCLGFAGSETDFLKAFQFTLRALDVGRRIGNVELGHFSAEHAAGVGYIEADRNRGAGGAAEGTLRLPKLKVV